MQPGDWDALRLSLIVSLGATLWIIAPGLATGWILSRRRLRGRSLIETLVALPLVLPPVVTGFLVLLLCSPRGPLAWLWEWLGTTPAFTPWGAILASGIVAFPLLARSAAAGFAAADDRLIAAAAGFGAGSQMIFRSVIWPQAKPALWSGIVLAFGRALGEFGATVVVAGNIPGLTQTIPLAIYQRVQIGDEWGALRLVLIAVILALATIGWATVMVSRRR
ncbi:MAG TPA: molybdate ABC transporter permease subunit [Acidobacteriota bacterium]|nr:molybdate ABC transporter permease subunit [Acidobacteriota bacterium]